MADGQWMSEREIKSKTGGGNRTLKKFCCVLRKHSLSGALTRESIEISIVLNIRLVFL